MGLCVSLSACMCRCTKARRWHQILWNWSWLWATWCGSWGLGTKPDPLQEQQVQVFLLFAPSLQPWNLIQKSQVSSVTTTPNPQEREPRSPKHRKPGGKQSQIFRTEGPIDTSSFCMNINWSTEVSWQKAFTDLVYFVICLFKIV